MERRLGKGKNIVRRFIRNIFLVLAGILCVSLFSSYSLAEEEFEAREGICWNITADGVLTIDNNWGWLDFQRDGFIERVNKLVIGKDLTDFLAFNDDPQETEEPNYFYPNFEPKQIEVEEGNPVFYTDSGLLINSLTREVVLSETGITNLIIPDGIQTINAFAFNQRSIESVQFPTTLKTIENEAFFACEHLTKVQFSYGLQYIGEAAFYHCAIRELTLPDSVLDIGEGAFQVCEGLKSVHLSAQLKLIPDGLFRGCIYLSEINLPEGLESIGEKAFMDCDNLIDPNLPEGLKYIGAEAFFGCHWGEQLTLPVSLQEIGEGAFQFADFSLVEFPETLKIGDSAFGRIHVAVFTGSDYELSDCSIDQVDNMLFLNNPPKGIPEAKAYSSFPMVYYTEPFADAWKAGVVNGLNGWPTKCVSLEEAETLIAQAIPTPEPTEEPFETTDDQSFHYSTSGTMIKSDKPDAEIDPIILVFAGLLALITTGMIILAARTTKKQHKKHIRKR